MKLPISVIALLALLDGAGAVEYERAVEFDRARGPTDGGKDRPTPSIPTGPPVSIPSGPSDGEIEPRTEDLITEDVVLQPGQAASCTRDDLSEGQARVCEAFRKKLERGEFTGCSCEGRGSIMNYDMQMVCVNCKDPGSIFIVGGSRRLRGRELYQAVSFEYEEKSVSSLSIQLEGTPEITEEAIEAAMDNLTFLIKFGECECTIPPGSDVVLCPVSDSCETMLAAASSR